MGFFLSNFEGFFINLKQFSKFQLLQNFQSSFPEQISFTKSVTINRIHIFITLFNPARQATYKFYGMVDAYEAFYSWPGLESVLELN